MDAQSIEADPLGALSTTPEDMDQELPRQSKERLARADIHEQWQRDYLGPELDRYYDAAFVRIVDELRDSTGKQVLDLGCGYCYHTTRLARSDLAITAADFSEAALAHARETLREAGIADRVTLRQADATRLSFADASFDSVVIWACSCTSPNARRRSPRSRACSGPAASSSSPRTTRARSRSSFSNGSSTSPSARSAAFRTSGDARRSASRNGRPQAATG